MSKNDKCICSILITLYRVIYVYKVGIYPCYTVHGFFYIPVCDIAVKIYAFSTCICTFRYRLRCLQVTLYFRMMWFIEHFIGVSLIQASAVFLSSLKNLPACFRMVQWTVRRWIVPLWIVITLYLGRGSVALCVWVSKINKFLQSQSVCEY